MGACSSPLYLLAEYGAFSILRFQTFTTEIFAEFEVGFNTPAASALSLVLVALGLIMLLGEALSARSVRRGRPQPRAHGVPRASLGAATLPWCLCDGALVGLGPGGAGVGHLALDGIQPTDDAPGRIVARERGLAHRLLQRLRRGRRHRCGPAGRNNVGALPGTPRRGLRALRSPGPGPARPGYSARPGVFRRSLRRFAYQSAGLLVAAYVVMFFPLALVAVRASVSRVPFSLEEVARSLGHAPAS